MPQFHLSLTNMLLLSLNCLNANPDLIFGSLLLSDPVVSLLNIFLLVVFLSALFSVLYFSSCIQPHSALLTFSDPPRLRNIVNFFPQLFFSFHLRNFDSSIAHLQSRLEMCMGKGKSGITWVPRDSHGNRSQWSHHLSLPRPFIPDLKLISFTSLFLHSHSYSFRTAFTDHIFVLYQRSTGIVCFRFFFWLRVLDKAEYSAFESTLNSSIVSYRTEYLISTLSESTVPRYIRCNFCLNLRSIHGDKEETVSGCFFLNTM